MKEPNEKDFSGDQWKENQALQEYYKRVEQMDFIKNGYFFNFCLSVALNKGFKDVMKEKKEVAFAVGDYNVKFDYEKMCFELIHKIYIFRIIHAYYNEVVFIGQTEEEVINDLSVEFEKECDY